MLNIIQRLALQQLLDKIPVRRECRADLTASEIEAVMMVHAQAVGFSVEQIDEFMNGDPSC
jgi:hypothetical protein